MINLLIPIKKHTITFAQIEHIVSSSSYSDELVVHIACERINPIVQEVHETSFQVVLDLYEPRTTADEMLAESLRTSELMPMIIVRDNAKNFVGKSLDLLIERAKSGSDIVMFKKQKKPNKIKSFFSNTFKKLCRKFFNFNFYDGDIGMQYFSEQAVKIMKQTNPTVPSKIYRWVGLKVEYIESSFEESKIRGLPKNILLRLAIYSLLFVGTIVFTIFLPQLVKINVFWVCLLLLVFMVEIVLLFYTLLKVYCHKKVGNLEVDKVQFEERRVYERV